MRIVYSEELFDSGNRLVLLELISYYNIDIVIFYPEVCLSEYLSQMYRILLQML